MLFFPAQKYILSIENIQLGQRITNNEVKNKEKPILMLKRRTCCCFSFFFFYFLISTADDKGTYFVPSFTL